MDGTSPGNLPVALGNVWVGEMQSCIIGDWPWQPFPTYPVAPVVVPYVAPQPHTHYHFTAPPRLSDEDVEHIARRVAELLREAKP